MLILFSFQNSKEIAAVLTGKIDHGVMILIPCMKFGFVPFSWLFIASWSHQP